MNVRCIRARVNRYDYGRMTDAELLAAMGPDSGATEGERFWCRYELRVRELEAEGCTRSDAQGVAEAELDP